MQLKSPLAITNSQVRLQASGSQPRLQIGVTWGLFGNPNAQALNSDQPKIRLQGAEAWALEPCGWRNCSSKWALSLAQELGDPEDIPQYKIFRGLNKLPMPYPLYFRSNILESFFNVKFLQCHVHWGPSAGRQEVLLLEKFY